MNFYDFLDLIWYSSTAVIVLPIWVGTQNSSKLTSQERWLVSLLLALLLLEIVATCLQYSQIRNHFIHYFRTLAVLWGGAFFFQPQVNLRRWPFGLAALLSILMPIEVATWVGFNHINTLTLGITWLLLTVYAFRCLKLMLDEPGSTSLRRNPCLYFYLGFFIIGFFTSITRFFENYFIETSLDLYYFSDTLTVMMSALAYSLFGAGLMKSLRTINTARSR